MKQQISITEHIELLNKYTAALAHIVGGLKEQPEGLTVPLEELNGLVERYRKVKARARAGLCEIGLAVVDGNTELAYTLIEELIIELEKI